MYASHAEAINLRGGSFQDDLRWTEPFIAAEDIFGREDAHNADIGFRLAGLIPCSYLPEAVLGELAVCPPLELVQFDQPAVE